jgi:hypothetical protein
LQAQLVSTVVPHPVHVPVELALLGMVTPVQLLVHVEYFPLQHKPLIVAVPLFESVQLQVLLQLHW